MGVKQLGPNTYSGTIGKQLETCEQLSVVVFEAIESDMPSVDGVDLSTDQKYLHDICNAVRSGRCSDDLSKRGPGKMSHARWLTTANRVLRLYVATLNPTAELKQLSEFVIKVYARVWFCIKTKPSCKYGGVHVWQMIQFSRYLTDPLKQVIDPVIQRNAYFAHPENLLLCIIADERTHMRELGLKRILKAKQDKAKSSVRYFKVPTLTFDSSDCIELFNWKNCKVTVLRFYLICLKNNSQLL